MKIYSKGGLSISVGAVGLVYDRGNFFLLFFMAPQEVGKGSHDKSNLIGTC